MRAQTPAGRDVSRHVRPCLKWRMPLPAFVAYALSRRSWRMPFLMCDMPGHARKLAWADAFARVPISSASLHISKARRQLRKNRWRTRTVERTYQSERGLAEGQTGRAFRLPVWLRSGRHRKTACEGRLGSGRRTFDPPVQLRMGRLRKDFMWPIRSSPFRVRASSAPMNARRPSACTCSAPGSECSRVRSDRAGSQLRRASAARARPARPCATRERGASIE